MRWFIVFLALVTFSAPMLACLNDRDTRRRQREAPPDDPMGGLPEIPQVLRGKFDRYPPVYYEMRRDRVAEELKRDPSQLALYDDIAVALGRLGEDDLAIEYMDQKLEQLNTAPGKDADADGHADWKEHWYSYHANQGTFYVHRWIHNGADFSNMDDLLTGQDLIAKAIEIKPNAHFGRERYQLKAIEWIASQPQFESGRSMPNMLGLSDDEITGGYGSDRLKELGMEDAVQGISGLIVLGAAWESVDATYALGIALRLKGDDENAYVALLRCKELIEAGRVSFVTGAPSGGALVHELGRLLPAPADDEKQELLKQNFTQKRAEAEDWRTARNDAMLGLLKQGKHPDTDKTFWAEVDQLTQAKQKVDPESSDTAVASNWLWIVLFGAIALALGGTAFTLIRRNREPEEPPVTPEEKLPMPGKDT